MGAFALVFAAVAAHGASALHGRGLRAVRQARTSYPSSAIVASEGRAAALGAALLVGGASNALAARSGGRVGGSVARGGGGMRGRGGGGGGYSRGGSTNIMITPGYSPYGFGGFGFSPFGFSPFGFSPFGFGFGGLFSPPSALLLAGLALVAFRSAREAGSAFGTSAGADAGAALLLQVRVLPCRVGSRSRGSAHAPSPCPPVFPAPCSRGCHSHLPRRARLRSASSAAAGARKPWPGEWTS